MLEKNVWVTLNYPLITDINIPINSVSSTSTAREIPARTISYTWSLNKVSLSKGVFPIGHYGKSPPPPPSGMSHKLWMKFTSQLFFNLAAPVHRRFSFFDNSTALAVSADDKFPAVFISIRTLKEKIHVKGLWRCYFKFSPIWTIWSPTSKHVPVQIKTRLNQS